MATSAHVIPFHHPDRPESEFRPLKAWHHFRKLMADKEDTEQVFHIIAALRGRKFRAIAEKFWHSDKGQNLLASDERLIDILDDHDTLKQLPAGTVGRAYVDFMEREGLSAAGLEARQRLDVFCKQVDVKTGRVADLAGPGAADKLVPPFQLIEDGLLFLHCGHKLRSAPLRNAAPR